MLDCWNLKYTDSIRDILDVLFPPCLMDAKVFLEFHSISVVSFGSWWIFVWSLLCSVRGRLYPLAGLQPLHAAAIAGHSDIVQILVEHGADANSRHRFAGNSALQLGFIQAWRPKHQPQPGTAKWPTCLPAVSINGIDLSHLVHLLHDCILLFILFD